MHFVAKQMPDDICNEKNKLEYQRETGSFPEFSRRDPKENVGNDECDRAPFY